MLLSINSVSFTVNNASQSLAGDFFILSDVKASSNTLINKVWFKLPSLASKCEDKHQFGAACRGLLHMQGSLNSWSADVKRAQCPGCASCIQVPLERFVILKLLHSHQRYNSTFASPGDTKQMGTKGLCLRPYKIIPTLLKAGQCT